MTDTLPGLRPQALAPLPLGQIQPTGWLLCSMPITIGCTAWHGALL